MCLIVSEIHDDGTVCSLDTCVDVKINKPFNVSLNPDPAFICPGQGCIDMEVIFDNDLGITYDEVQTFSWNGGFDSGQVQEFCDVSPSNFIPVSYTHLTLPTSDLV